MRFGDLQPGDWFRHEVRFYSKCHPMAGLEADALEYDADRALSKPVNAMNILAGTGNKFSDDLEVSIIASDFRDAAIVLLHR